MTNVLSFAESNVALLTPKITHEELYKVVNRYHHENRTKTWGKFLIFIALILATYSVVNRVVHAQWQETSGTIVNAKVEEIPSTPSKYSRSQFSFSNDVRSNGSQVACDIAYSAAGKHYKAEHIVFDYYHTPPLIDGNGQLQVPSSGLEARKRADARATELTGSKLPIYYSMLNSSWTRMKFLFELDNQFSKWSGISCVILLAIGGWLYRTTLN